MTAPLVEILGLPIQIGRGARPQTVFDGVNLRVANGETLCLLGASRWGKSLMVLSIPRLLPAGSDVTEVGSKLDGKERLTFL